MKPGRTLFTRSLVLLLVLLLSAAGPAIRIGRAQSDTVTWSAAINLSNSPQNSSHPAIVADAYGNVHVFWSEDADGGPKLPTQLVSGGNTIFYTRWNGQSWTTPVDVLYVPGEAIANYVSVKADDQGRLHAVWTGQRNIYYSSALAWEAGSARAWSQPQAVATDSARTTWESDVIVDSAGSVHILYATGGSEAGIYHIRSDDGGETWSPPVQLSQPLDALETSLANVRVINDRAGRLHAVWQSNQVQGYGQAVYYSRSTDGGTTWSVPAQLGYRGPTDTWVELPFIVAKSESELHLIYTNGTNKARAYRVSADGGVTWSEARDVLTDLEGINGYHQMVVDGAGEMHLLMIMRWQATQKGGVMYANWQGSDWSQAGDIYDQPGNSAHYPAATISRGNEIHVVWNEISPGEIWYMRGTIQGQAAQPVLPVPTAESAPTPVPAETISIAPVARHAEQMSINASAPSPGQTSFGPLVAGIGATLGLVAALVILRQARKRYR